MREKARGGHYCGGRAFHLASTPGKEHTRAKCGLLSCQLGTTRLVLRVSFCRSHTFANKDVCVFRRLLSYNILRVFVKYPQVLLPGGVVYTHRYLCFRFRRDCTSGLHAIRSTKYLARRAKVESRSRGGQRVVQLSTEMKRQTSTGLP